MYWVARSPSPPGWHKPTVKKLMSFTTWLGKAADAREKRLGPDDKHHYFVLGTNRDFTRKEVKNILTTQVPPRKFAQRGEMEFTGASNFVLEDLPIFDARRAAMAEVAKVTGQSCGGITKDEPASFFIRQAIHNKGVQCRIGMRGVIAEAHYDAGRNMIAMLRGKKRYVLTPPESCPALNIIASRQHPSFRHSQTDWSLYPQRERLDKRGEDAPQGSGGGAHPKVLETLGRAQALETVLRAGEVMYLPSYWFHYIVSLDGDISVQCNTRHGPPPLKQGEAAIVQCIGRDNFEHG
mmetsp:Transcript_40609/g.127027  ORF Transcript_40609/g.127027 Transcript_40609/m.127027 type:complete len:294 (-) Transcript_40609:81-962(-)